MFLIISDDRLKIPTLRNKPHFPCCCVCCYAPDWQSAVKLVCALQGFLFFSSILAFVTHGNAVVFTSHRAQSWLFILTLCGCQMELLGACWACASFTELAAAAVRRGLADVSVSAGSPQLLQAPWGKNNMAHNNLSWFLPGLSLYTPQECFQHLPTKLPQATGLSDACGVQYLQASCNI